MSTDPHRLQLSYLALGNHAFIEQGCHTFKCAAFTVVDTKDHPFELTVSQTGSKQCVRCRNYRYTVGENKYFPDLCEFCFKFVCDLPEEKQISVLFPEGLNST